MSKFILTLVVLLGVSTSSYSSPEGASVKKNGLNDRFLASKSLPKVEFIAELPTPGEFTLFASGGWAGNWYVGYNQKWISVLPAVNINEVEKVFIGARLGRAKTQKQIDEIFKSREEPAADLPPVDFNHGPYSILIGVSDSKDNKPEGVVLTTTDRIPLEGSPVAALERVSESRWFWVEIGKDILNTEGENYIFLWSEDKEMDSAGVAPILAAGIGSNERENSYIVTERASKVIKFFEPALAIKLVGKNPPVPAIRITDFYSHPIDTMKQVVEVDVSGKYITEVRVELNSGKGWESTDFTATTPPYNLVFSFKDLAPGKYKLRCLARNWHEAAAYSNFKTFEIAEE